MKFSKPQVISSIAPPFGTIAATFSALAVGADAEFRSLNRRTRFRSTDEWSFEVDWFMEGQFENTMHRLMKAFHKIMIVPDELEHSLEQALKLRNFLAHHYFRERDVVWFTQQGRESMAYR